MTIHASWSVSVTTAYGGEYPEGIETLEVVFDMADAKLVSYRKDVDCSEGSSQQESMRFANLAGTRNISTEYL